MRRNRLLKPAPELAQLMAIGCGKYIGWDECDLAETIQAQLRAPLLATLKPNAGQIHSLVGKSNSDEGVLPANLGDLLNHTNPPLPLLCLAKDYAKSADTGPNPLPNAVAAAIYLSAIAAAIVRHEQRISSMSDSDLEAGLQWVAEQAWAGPLLHQLAKDALAVLNRGLEGSPA